MAGPFLLKLKEGKQHNLRSKTQNQLIKGYVAVFVCLVTRAVHLEPVMDMSADAFKTAFLRFVARRGPCELMMSDNGTNFVAADKDLREAYETWQSPRLMHDINTEGTRWQFITPAAPHEGGLWEAAVKSMKHHLRRVMGVHKYTFEGIATLLAGIEACLNSRPLCAMSDDPNDAETLTPAHFLIGGPLKLPLPFAAGTEPKEMKGRQLYNHLRKQQDDFWKAWSSDYLSSLMQRKKWRKERENLKIGQMVLIKSENYAPCYRRLGRIVKVYAGSDGFVRSATVKVENGELDRPVRKLCVLPTDEDILKYWD